MVALALSEPLVPVKTTLLVPAGVLPEAANVTDRPEWGRIVSGKDGVTLILAGRLEAETVTLLTKPSVGTTEISTVWFSPAVVKLSVPGETWTEKLGRLAARSITTAIPQAERTAVQASTKANPGFFPLGIGTQLPTAKNLRA